MTKDDTCHPWPHQYAITKYTCQVPRHGVLWNAGMGVGKTRCLVEVCNWIKPKTVLVVTKKAVLPGFAEEIEQWNTLKNCHVEVLNKGTVKTKREKMLKALKYADHGYTVYIVVNYETVWRNRVQVKKEYFWKDLAEAVLNQQWDIVCADECDNIKNKNAKVSKFFHALTHVATLRIGMSGTPMPGGPLDAFSLYKFLDPGLFGDGWTRFVNRYALLDQFRRPWKYLNMQEFKEKLHSIMITVDTEEAQPWLPEKHHIRVPVELEPKARKIYNALENEFYAELESGEITVTNALTKGLRLQQVTSGYLLPDDAKGQVNAAEQISRAKEEALKELLLQIKKDEQVVVFCRYRLDLLTVHRLCLEVKRSSGELSGSRDDKKAFLKGDINTIAVQLQAGGVGINELVAARYCIYYSNSFSYRDYEQSLKRIHRPGQERTVFYYHLVVKDSIDEKIYSALKRKKDVIAMIMEKEAV